LENKFVSYFLGDSMIYISSYWKKVLTQANKLKKLKPAETAQKRF